MVLITLHRPCPLPPGSHYAWCTNGLERMPFGYWMARLGSGSAAVHWTEVPFWVSRTASCTRVGSRGDGQHEIALGAVSALDEAPFVVPTCCTNTKDEHLHPTVLHWPHTGHFGIFDHALTRHRFRTCLEMHLSCTC